MGEKTKQEEGELRLGVRNVEETLFHDAAAWRLMPDMARFRDQWALSRMSPALRPTGRAAVLDFLNSAGREHEAALTEYFGRPVTIDRADRRSVANVEFDADSPPDLEEMSVYSGFGSFRKGDRVYVTFWR